MVRNGISFDERTDSVIITLNTQKYPQVFIQ